MTHSADGGPSTPGELIQMAGVSQGIRHAKKGVPVMGDFDEPYTEVHTPKQTGAGNWQSSQTRPPFPRPLYPDLPGSNRPLQFSQEFSMPSELAQVQHQPQTRSRQSSGQNDQPEICHWTIG